MNRVVHVSILVYRGSIRVSVVGFQLTRCQSLLPTAARISRMPEDERNDSTLYGMASTGTRKPLSSLVVRVLC